MIWELVHRVYRKMTKTARVKRLKKVYKATNVGGARKYKDLSTSGTHCKTTRILKQSP